MTVSRRRITRGAAALGLALTASCGHPSHPAQTPAPSVSATLAAPARPTPTVTPRGDFGEVSQLLNDAIAAHRLPGAVVQVGHAGSIIFRQAYGARRLAGEPDLDGALSPAEPMTTDTIFDLASMTKVLATTTAVLQLYEQHRIGLDDPVQTHLPEFNVADDPVRSRVTLRMLLTHTSGIGGDLSHQGPWGLTAADKADGVHRALTAPLEFAPGALFHYSDINFIILGALVEQLSGEPLDKYVQDNVFGPLGMADTRYLPASKVCGPHQTFGTAIAFDPRADPVRDCPDGAWSTDLLGRIAPTAHDEDTPGINPDFDHLLRGTVHDPTARRMGGVAGSAGVFSTVQDVGLFAQALLDRLAGRPGPFPLSQATLQLATTPQQPGHNVGQVAAAENAFRRTLERGEDPRYPAIAGQDLRGLGWDIDTRHSQPRGIIFPIGSFGHTGFTGVTMWVDPRSDSYVIVLANVIHQRGGPPIGKLSGEVATAVARALHLYGS